MNRLMLFLLTAVPTAALAQEAPDVGVKVEGTRETTTTVWYTNPWLIGGLIALILVIALIAGAARRGGDDRTTIIKT